MMLDQNSQDRAVNAIAHAAEMFNRATQELIDMNMRPHMLYKPKLFPDGNQWCALFGEDIQSGVAGFGDTPRQAMHEFDRVWYNSTLPKERQKGESNKIEDPKQMTDYELLLALVPDFAERYRAADKPLRDELFHRAVGLDSSWRPLEYWKGCM